MGESDEGQVPPWPQSLGGFEATLEEDKKRIGRPAAPGSARRDASDREQRQGEGSERQSQSGKPQFEEWRETDADDLREPTRH